MKVVTRSSKVLIVSKTKVFPKQMQKILQTENFSCISCSDLGEISTYLSKNRGLKAVLLDADFEALHLACRQILSGQRNKTNLPIVVFSFKKMDEKDPNQSLFAIPGFRFIQIPFLISEFKQAVQEVLKAKPRREQIERAMEVIKENLAEKIDEIWANFEHECRKLSNNQKGWRRLKNELLPKLKNDLKKFAGGNRSHKELEKLRKIVSSKTPAFDRLYNFFGGWPRTAGTSNVPAAAQTISRKPTQKSTNAFLTTIMVIEDDQNFAGKVTNILEKIGHKVIKVTDQETRSESILKSIQTNNVEVVLLDLKLGTIERGFKILKEIKEKRPETKVIVLTGYGGKNIIEARCLGADDYIIKPIDKNTLRNTLGEKIKQVLVERRILLIDDDVGDLVTPDFQERFEAKRCQLYTYKHPERALEDLTNGKIDINNLHLVLLDLKFGKSFKPGFKAFKGIKKIRKDLPIIILTGYDDDEIRQNVAFGELKDFFTPQRDGFIVKHLTDESWNSIWGALFPEPKHLVLFRSSKSIQLKNGDGSVIVNTELPPKHFTLLFALALKRMRNLTGIRRSAVDQDAELQEVRRWGLPFYTWTAQGVAECRCGLNRHMRDLLRSDWELVHSLHSDGTYYILNPAINEVTIED